MRLLEREEPLAALREARDAAAAGSGSVVLVTGEPGIGKTALLRRFTSDLSPDARVLWGMCDDLSIPRPLGPLHDLTGLVSARLEQALSSAAPVAHIQDLVLTELDAPPKPTLLVLEDVHWADEATLDLMTVIGRRISTLSAVLVLSVREGEAGLNPPVRASLGALSAGSPRHLTLGPLSRTAVAALAGEDAEQVYTLTGGNPFYVTELLAARPEQLPASVANAVLGRAARLGTEARALVELISVVPTRTATSLLDVVMPDWAAAAEEPERRELVQVDANHVRFRHELARTTIRSSLPVARRRGLHARILRALLAVGADAADIVYHAEAAGETEVVAEHALVAARTASALESNREAHSHYRRAADFADRLPVSEQARLLEELAQTAYTIGRLDEAFTAIHRAIRLNEQLEDQAATGRCRRMLSRYHWYAGEGEAARTQARSAIDILEPLGPSAELARAYSGLSQLAMLAFDSESAIRWGERAVDLARGLDDRAIVAHALVNVGMTRYDVDPDDWSTVMEAHRIADAAGDRHEAVRALIGIAFGAYGWARPDLAVHYTESGIRYAREHEVDTLLSYLVAMLAWLRLRAGDWSGAESLATAEMEKGVTVAQLLAETVLTELAVRRGDDDASQRLTELRDRVDRTAELQRIGPIFELEVEQSLIGQRSWPKDRLECVLRTVGRAGTVGWGGARLVAWAAVADIALDFDGPMPEPHAAMARRDWASAAQRFADIGWTYDRALMLSMLRDEAALTEALGTARQLGATPLTGHVETRMRSLGYPVPRGPHDSTRSNPAGLTNRQLEVLALMTEGLTDAEIAARLCVSRRTAEHHVAAVLHRLDVRGRREAIRRAAELGVVDR